MVLVIAIYRLPDALTSTMSGFECVLKCRFDKRVLGLIVTCLSRGTSVENGRLNCREKHCVLCSLCTKNSRCRSERAGNFTACHAMA